MIVPIAQIAPTSASTSLLMHVGVGGILCILILQLVFKFVKEMKDKKEKKGSSTTNPSVVSPQVISDIFGTLNDIKKLSQDLHEWHDVKDEDHVFAWYIRKSLSDSITNLNKSVGSLANGVAKMNEMLRHLTEEETDG